MASPAVGDGTGSRVIAVEGPNGAGKSSVAAHIATRIGGAVVRYPDSFMRIRQTALIDEQAPLPRLLYYLGGIAQLHGVVAQQRGPFVCDRYYASPLAMLLAEGAVGEGELAAIAGPVLDRITMPAVTVLLTADHAELVARIAGRGGARPGVSYRQTLLSPEFVAAWTSALRSLAAGRGPVIEIDTTVRDVAEVCAIVDNALPALGVDW